MLFVKVLEIFNLCMSLFLILVLLWGITNKSQGEDSEYAESDYIYLKVLVLLYTPNVIYYIWAIFR